MGTRDIRRRIKSVRNTSLITKAMQMVATSKMAQAQAQALQGRAFAAQLGKILRDIGRHALEVEHPLWRGAADGAPPAVLLISTDKGLCGGLNANLFRVLAALPAETVLVTIGRRGRQFAARTKRRLLADFPLPERIAYPAVKHIAEYLSEAFLRGEIGSLTVLYPRFVNTLVQKPLREPLLPLADLNCSNVGLLGETVLSADHDTGADFVYEPSASAVRDKLFPMYVNFNLYHMLLEARASEHSARMVAMKNATDNARQLTKDLTLEYNKVRQTAITNEILEIAAAQAAGD
ncbi:MAG: ATP synthase F1 subunit gamma [Verrucomicrobiales bacterium]|jgi:F-type H+-transporting ATPase subunit gamma|nr:ATP synthase F1 subunit gamma [Verrucomicrobiales bacterium]